MKVIKKYILAVLFFVFASMFPSIVANATACFFTADEVSGFNRICYYDCMSGERAITIDSMEFCPLTIEE